MQSNDSLSHLRRLLGLEDSFGNPSIPLGLPVQIVGKLGQRYIFPPKTRPLTPEEKNNAK